MLTGSRTRMGDFPHYFDIILFAMIAVFLALRLRSVLGRRTGNERRRQSMIRQAEPTGDNVIALPQRGNAAAPAPATQPPADAVAAGLDRIRAAHAGLDPELFLHGPPR